MGLYNRYIPRADGYTRVAMEEERREGFGQTAKRDRGRNEPSRTDPVRDIVRNITAPLNLFGGENKNAGIAGILKSLHLDDVDSGDILLLLIILLLVLEGDGMELAITLGLMLLMSLGEEKNETQKE